jgi:hypothetical protein
MLIYCLVFLATGFEAKSDPVTLQSLNAKADSLARQIDALQAEGDGGENNLLAAKLDWGRGWFLTCHFYRDLIAGYTFKTPNRNRLSVGVGLTTASYETEYIVTSRDSVRSSVVYHNEYPAAMLRVGMGSKVLHNFISVEVYEDWLALVYIHDKRFVDFGTTMGAEIAFWLTTRISLLLGAQLGITVFPDQQAGGDNPPFSEVRLGLRYYPKCLNRHVAKGTRD